MYIYYPITVYCGPVVYIYVLYIYIYVCILSYYSLLWSCWNLRLIIFFLCSDPSSDFPIHCKQHLKSFCAYIVLQPGSLGPPHNLLTLLSHFPPLFSLCSSHPASLLFPDHTKHIHITRQIFSLFPSAWNALSPEVAILTSFTPPAFHKLCPQQVLTDNSKITITSKPPSLAPSPPYYSP